MIEIKLTTVGNSVGAVFPKEVLEYLNAKKGDTLHLVKTRDGFEIHQFSEQDDSEVKEKMDAADAFMRKYHHALKKLADS